jgi:hypothetical protein
MPLDGKVIFGVSLKALSAVLSDMASDKRLNGLLKGSVLENTALVVTDKEFGVFALDSAGLSVPHEREFVETLKPILQKHLPADPK